MTREEILTSNSLLGYVESKGAKIKRSGREMVTNLCPVNTHKPSHLCVSINPDKALWRCHDCDKGGSLIDWLMMERGQTAAEVLDSFDPAPNGPRASQPQRQKRPSPPAGSKEPEAKKTIPGASVEEIEATYDYTDETGKLIFQVVRYKPKTFKQRQPDGKGDWIWGLDGVVRVLFNLPAVLLAETVFIVEGEKDCQTLGRLGYTATTNAGGSQGWLFAYGIFLRGKDVIVIPDRDSQGQKHGDAVVASLTNLALSIKRITLPNKDVTDFAEANGEATKAALDKLIEQTPHILKPMALYNLGEMENHYRQFVRKFNHFSFDFGKFLPDLGKLIEPLYPGDLVLVIADTGVGKSAILSAIARGAHPLPTLFFELELSLDTMFVRLAQMELGCLQRDVLADYRNHNDSFIENMKGLSHILVCPEAGLTVDQISDYIERSELKLGKRPALVFIDYVGLLRHAKGRDRYERISDSAENLKIAAKNTNTIIFVASQVSRPPKERKTTTEISLHDAKDSGSLENSAGLVLGCTRPDDSTIAIKILKNTKGTSGKVVEAFFDGARMRISPMVKKEDDDL